MSRTNRVVTSALFCLFLSLVATSLFAQTSSIDESKRALQTKYSLSPDELSQVTAFAPTSKAAGAVLRDYDALRAAGMNHVVALAALTRIQAAQLRATIVEATQSFMGFNWGLGFGLSVDLEHGDRVDTAELVDGVVRVTGQSDELPRIVLEGHHFLFHNGGPEVTDATLGHGPYIAVQSSGEDAISGFGAGWMVGFRYKPTSPSSFNLGLGVIVDANVQTLGDGIEANQPLPGAETQIRFKKESRAGLLFFGSFSF